MYTILYKIRLFVYNNIEDLQKDLPKLLEELEVPKEQTIPNPDYH